MNENEILTEETLAGEPPVTDEVLMEESLEEPPAMDQECTGNLTVEEEQSKDKSPVEEQQVGVDLCATLPSLADETPVTDEVLMEDSLEELPAIDQECTGNLTLEEQQSKDKSPVEEQQVVVDLCATLPSLEEQHVINQECTGVEEDFQTDFFHVEQKDVTTADSVQEVTKEMQQSTATMVEEDVSEDQLETDFIFAEQHKDPKLTGTDDEVHEKEKAIQIIEQMPQSIGSMNECVQEGVKIDFVHADELKKVITADDMLEVTETEDKAVQRESAFAGDITSALLDDINESLSIITITESTVSRDKDVPMCKNNIENNNDDPACKNKSENTDVAEQCKNKSENNIAELVAMQENMGLKVAKKPADLNVLSLRKLRAKYKKKMEVNTYSSATYMYYLGLSFEY
jgi:hypothetical protein